VFESLSATGHLLELLVVSECRRRVCNRGIYPSESSIAEAKA